MNNKISKKLSLITKYITNYWTLEDAMDHYAKKRKLELGSIYWNYDHGFYLLWHKLRYKNRLV